MPKTRPLGPPPDERPNWNSLNEGQKRYAWEQYNLAKVRRGIPIDHPIPGTSNAEPAQLNTQEQDYINEFDLFNGSRIAKAFTCVSLVCKDK